MASDYCTELVPPNMFGLAGVYRPFDRFSIIYRRCVSVRNQLGVITRELIGLYSKKLAAFSLETVMEYKKGANIIVFPEDGIYGMVWNGSRDLILPFLEVIPDPREQWNPCLKPEAHEHSDVQIFLSCIARDNGMFVVANFGDVLYCEASTDPNCPTEGRYQYNTDVVYDPSGLYVTKYHKYNLYGEAQFDRPANPQITVFNTTFGRFGIFTCFDMLFQHPAIDLIRDYYITNIIFPTAWMDAAPFLTSVQFHSAFAIANGVNLLSANIHFPMAKFHGSGIFSPSGKASYYYDTKLLSKGRLLVQNVTTVDKPKTLRNDTYVKVLGEKKKSFTATLFHDVYRLVRLSDASSSKVCHNDFCCNISVSFGNGSGSFNPVFQKRSGDVFYAIGAFDGLHVDDKDYYIQVCAVIPCRESVDGKYLCGEDESVKQDLYELPRLNSMKMFGNFATPYVYPSMLLQGNEEIILPQNPHQWLYSNGYLKLETPLTMPLNVASMFARNYEKDK